MAAQATVIDGIASMFESESAVLIGIVAAAVLYVWLDVWLDPQLPFADLGVPWRQIMQNRIINHVGLSCRTFCSVVRFGLAR